MCSDSLRCVDNSHILLNSHKFFVYFCANYPGSTVVDFHYLHSTRYQLVINTNIFVSVNSLNFHGSKLIHILLPRLQCRVTLHLFFLLCSWYDRSRGATEKEKQNNAIKQIQYYFFHVVRGVGASIIQNFELFDLVNLSTK